MLAKEYQRCGAAWSANTNHSSIVLSYVPMSAYKPACICMHLGMGGCVGMIATPLLGGLTALAIMMSFSHTQISPEKPSLHLAQRHNKVGDRVTQTLKIRGRGRGTCWFLHFEAVFCACSTAHSTRTWTVILYLGGSVIFTLGHMFHTKQQQRQDS